MAVQADELQRRHREDPAGGLGRRAAAQRQAELLVVVGGGDELVGVGLDAHGDPDQDLGPHAVLVGQVAEAGDLLEGVDDDVADPGRDGLLELGDRLVVAVHGDPVGREADTQRDGQLTGAAHVDAEALLHDPPGDLAAQERLGGVVDLAVVEGLAELGRAGPEVLLVEDVEGVPYSLARSRTSSPPIVSDPAILSDVRGQMTESMEFRSAGAWGRTVLRKHLGMPVTGRMGESTHPKQAIRLRRAPETRAHVARRDEKWKFGRSMRWKGGTGSCAPDVRKKNAPA